MNKEAAGRAEKELGAQVIIIKKTSPEYANEKDPPPCPSVKVNGTFIAKNDIVSYEALKDALLSDSGRKEGS
jgi:hypothetical protein